MCSGHSQSVLPSRGKQSGGFTIDKVETDQEVDDHIAFGFRDVFKESGGDFVAGGESAVDGNGKNEASTSPTSTPLDLS